MLYRTLFAVAAIVSLTACTTLPPSMQKQGTPTTLTAAQLTSVQEGVRARLKDPVSAMFPGETRAAVAADGEITACGLVNAKNSFGGYTGASLYIAVMKGGTVVDATVENSEYGIVQSFCRQRGVAI